jgi:hypothetical protein
LQRYDKDKAPDVIKKYGYSWTISTLRLSEGIKDGVRSLLLVRVQWRLGPWVIEPKRSKLASAGLRVQLELMVQLARKQASPGRCAQQSSIPKLVVMLNH